LIHGTITEQKQAELDGAKRLFEKLYSAVTALSEATGEEVPLLEVICSLIQWMNQYIISTLD
jgi:hypothetical protein